MRIVCFHLNQVGDLAFALPALRCMRDSFPDATITSVARPAFVELLSESGLVDEVIPRPGGVTVPLIRRLRGVRPDLAVVLSQSASCAVLAYLSGARERAGFVNTSLGFLLTRRVSFQHPPSTENNLRLLSQIGCRITRSNYVGLLNPGQEAAKRADGILGQSGIGMADKVVALAPGTSGRRSVKEWTDEGFARVARYATSVGARVVLLGRLSAPNLVKDCPEIIDLSGRTTLAEAAAVLERCSALVAVDSGILHLGAAAGTKVIGLYGPSNWRVTGPQGEGHVVITSGADCSPCMRTECNLKRICMTNIDPESVVEALSKLLEKAR